MWSVAPVAAVLFDVRHLDPSNEFCISACVADSVVCSHLVAPRIGLHEFSWWVPLVSSAHTPFIDSHCASLVLAGAKPTTISSCLLLSLRLDW